MSADVVSVFKRVDGKLVYLRKLDSKRAAKGFEF